VKPKRAVIPVPRLRKNNITPPTYPAPQESPGKTSPSWWRRWWPFPSQPQDTSNEYFTRWPWWRRWFGQRCERVAASHLRRLGYTLLAANLRLPGGEIDLLAIDSDTLVVVEVRSTQSSRADVIQEVAASVDQRKQEKLTRAALAFLARHRALGQIPVRFDVLVIAWPPQSRYPLIHHIPNAFPAQGRYQFFC